MRKAGFRRVRPLHGGLAAWRSLGFPTEDIVSATIGDQPVAAADR